MHQKYIRVKLLNGIKDVFVTFSGKFNHSDMMRQLCLCKEDIVSAGFVTIIHDGCVSEYLCFGKSITLDIGHLEEDSEKLNGQIYEG